MSRNIHLFFDKKAVQESELKTFVENALKSIALSNKIIRTRLEKFSV